MSEITNCDDLKKEVDQTETSDKGRQSALISRALELGCIDHIPDDWGIEVKSDGGNGSSKA